MFVFDFREFGLFSLCDFGCFDQCSFALKHIQEYIYTKTHTKMQRHT